MAKVIKFRKSSVDELIELAQELDLVECFFVGKNKEGETIAFFAEGIKPETVALGTLILNDMVLQGIYDEKH